MSFLLLRPHDLDGLVSMKDAIDVIEMAYREASNYPIINAPRRRVHSPDNVRISNFPGGVHSLGVMGSQTRADLLRFENDAQIYAYREHPVFNLFDSKTGRLFAIMLGEVNEKTLGYTSLMGLRTGATSGVGFRHLPRKDVKTVGIFGSAGQALNQLLALKTERPIEKVKVYSRDPARRRAFAEEASRKLDLDIVPADSPRETCRNVDVIVTATNSNVPVFDGDWIEPGQHICGIIGSNAALVKGGWLKSRRRENDDKTIVRADVLVVNYIESIFQDEQADLLEPLEKGLITRDKLRELGDLLNGRIEGRTADEQVTLHKNHIGLGIADLAVAKMTYERAKEAGRGTVIDLPEPGE